MKILNCYAGIGGNRKLWPDEHEITAIELNPDIAKIYQDFFPKDKVIVTDAHQYLLEHFQEFDFIWSSIDCTSHTRARFWASKGNRYKPIYPDMKLYEEILFLKHYFKGLWVVENVKPYYKPLIEPTIKIERHLFWSNFNISSIKIEKNRIFDGNIKLWQNKFGLNISNYKISTRKDKVLRNCVEPELGLHILEASFKNEQFNLF